MEFSEKCDTTEVTMDWYEELFSVCPEFKLMCEKLGAINIDDKVSE